MIVVTGNRKRYKVTVWEVNTQIRENEPQSEEGAPKYDKKIV
jgi:hypothetical protein